MYEQHTISCECWYYNLGGYTDGYGLLSHLMNVEETISDVGSDEIYTYCETCHCRLIDCKDCKVAKLYPTPKRKTH